MIDLLMRAVDKVFLALTILLLAWIVYAGITEIRDFRRDAQARLGEADRLQRIIRQNDSVWPAPPNDPKAASEAVLGRWKDAPFTGAFHAYDFGL